MSTPRHAAPAEPGRQSLVKAPTGITGFDEMTGGGLPRGRTTLVTGHAGSGKTLFGMEFLVRGALEHGEPGVLLSFEETADDLRTNVASIGFDLAQLERDGLISVDAFLLDSSLIYETGPFDLEGLFLRLGAAVDAVGARRVVIDTIEVLFTSFSGEALVRTELSRIFRWLKDRGLTAVVTGERGRDGLTRYGIEEYVSDCVIVLDHRVSGEISTRRMRVVKYRGSTHGTNEYPFIIAETGITVVPITSLALTYDASDERIPTGIESLDEMLAGGVYRGSTMMISGGAGTGKTSIAAHMVDATCARGERALFYSLEESPAQLVRNMRSIGLDLSRWVDAGLLKVWAQRPTAHGLEEHLAMLHRLLDDWQPEVVVLDAVASLVHGGDPHDLTSVMARDLDALKSRGITALMTALSQGDMDSGGLLVSSLVDTWLVVRNQESNGELNRLLFVIKSRGSAHSNQVREFQLTDQGARLVEPYVGPSGVLTGSARVEQELRERAEADELRRFTQAQQEAEESTAATRAAVVARRSSPGDPTRGEG